jgi:Trp operon repressor
MRRYDFLGRNNVYAALNRLRAVLMAAKDGHDVEEIVKGVLTQDERVKIGRRIEIAEMLSDGVGHDEIADELKVGKTTIAQVSQNLERHPRCFELIDKRLDKVDREYERSAYRKVGGSKLIHKKREYTGFSKKDVKR